MRKLLLIPVLMAGLMVAPAAMAKGLDYYKQDRITVGGRHLSGSMVASHFGLVGASSMSCYGYDGWKKGKNAVGIVIWSLHNRTYWCGIPGDRIVKGSVSGEIRTWTGPLWEVHDKTWQKLRDPLHPQTSRYTVAAATFAEGANGFDVMSETISRRYQIHADGTVR